MRLISSRLALAFLLLGGCASAPLAAPDAILTEDQTLDLMAHSNRWIGRIVTLRIYPYDNGYRGSFVACLEACDAAGADRTMFLIYTSPERFKGYRGDRAEVVKAVFGKICPDNLPMCLDAPLRAFALNEVAR